MYIEIFTEMFKMSQNNEELKNFFNCYIECLLLGYNTMIWSILDDNNLQFIEKFFNKLYQNHVECYYIKKYFTYNEDKKEYIIRWFHSPEEREGEEN